MRVVDIIKMLLTAKEGLSRGKYKLLVWKKFKLRKIILDKSYVVEKRQLTKAKLPYKRRYNPRLVHFKLTF